MTTNKGNTMTKTYKPIRIVYPNGKRTLLHRMTSASKYPGGYCWTDAMWKDTFQAESIEEVKRLLSLYGGMLETDLGN
jgi:hypothetical protein